MRVARFIIFFILFALAVSNANADAVSDWNRIAVQASLTAGAPPGPAARVGATTVIDIAIVHAAIYDAVQAIERKYEPYYLEIPGASGSTTAAVARAARDVLLSRYPAQAAALETTYQNYLISKGIASDDPGLAVGAKAAAAIIAARSCDGSFPDPPPAPFIGGTAIGEWRPTTPGTSLQAVWAADMRPYLLTRPSQFRVDPPPPVGSPKYVKDYIEVKNYGSSTSTYRTPEQTDMARFWGANIPVMMNQMVRDIADDNLDSPAETSRMFALATMSMADSFIACWNNKRHYNFWRPVTAIREDDGFDSTPQDPAWTPLIPTPPYPDYVSGANALSGAAVHSLEKFFDSENINFSITTTNTGPTEQDTRNYTRLSQVADEVVDARIYLGIHFRFADTAARKLGRDVAHYGYKNYFRPMGGKEQ